MCGIIYIKSSNVSRRVGKTVLKRYEVQKHRGSDGFGFIAMKDGKVSNYVLKEKEGEIRQHVKNEDTSEMLFHHRLPTSTPNLYEAAHPIEVDNESLKYKYYLAHNGVITNAKELYTAHQKLGFSYCTEIRTETRVVTRDRQIHKSVEIKFNDSESLAIELARYVEGLSKSIDTRGAAAFVMWQVDRKTGEQVKVFFGRNEGNPLHIEKNNEMFILKSSMQNGEEVEPNKMFFLDPKKNVVSEMAKVDIGYFFSYKKPDYSGFDKSDESYKGTSAGFTGNKSNHLGLPSRTDINKDQKTLVWVEDEPEVKRHAFPGDDYSQGIEDELNDLEVKKSENQIEMNNASKELVSLRSVSSEQDRYFELLGIIDTCRENIKDIDKEIDDLFEKYYQNN